MNTKELGDSFELKVYEKFKKLLENNKLYVNKELSEIKYKPKYYSSKRKTNIVFDISIETQNYSMGEVGFYIIIECKNLSQKVDVSDIEEFESKLTQVAEHNSKGILCTTIGFQKSCIEIAKSSKIALVRLSPCDDLTWDLARTRRYKQVPTNVDEKIFNTLTNSDIRIPEGYFGAFFNGHYTYSIIEFIENILGGERVANNIEKIVKKYSAPYITKEKIHEILISDFKHRNIHINNNNYYTSVIQYINSYKNDIEIIDNCDLGVDKDNNEIIGKYSEGKIYTVDAENFNNSRYLFTIAHELGHKILHSDSIWYNDFANEYTDINLSDIDYHRIRDDLKILEIQANYFAADLLVPDNVLKLAMKQIILEERLVDKGYGYIYLDHQGVNRKLLNNILQKLKSIFKASKAVLEIKLKKLGYLNIAYENKDSLLKFMQNFKEKFK